MIPIFNISSLQLCPTLSFNTHYFFLKENQVTASEIECIPQGQNLLQMQAHGSCSLKHNLDASPSSMWARECLSASAANFISAQGTQDESQHKTRMKSRGDHNTTGHYKLQTTPAYLLWLSWPELARDTITCCSDFITHGLQRAVTSSWSCGW